MNWSDIFPTLSDSQVAEFQDDASAEELALLDDYCAVERVINPQEGKHLVVASLFWKHSHENGFDLPPLTLELIKNAPALGLVDRFAPWEHYIQPLLEGAVKLKQLRPEIVFRVYLAKDLDFLIPDLVDVGCEVMLMKSSSVLHNPGAMWRFLALEEEGRWVTITDSDRAPKVIHDVEITEYTMSCGNGFWRVPNIYDSAKNGNAPGLYRPIIACQFGALGGMPIDLLMRAFLWHTLRDTMPKVCTIPNEKEAITNSIFGTDWPSYGFDEWFLLAVAYPRLALGGVVTLIPWHAEPNHWFALDIEYVTWANPKSEIIHFGSLSFTDRFKISPATENATSPILNRLIYNKQMEVDSSTIESTKCSSRLTLVVARYNEDIDWLLELPEDVDIVVYNKGEEISAERLLARIKHLESLSNVGRETDTYLHHLQCYPHGPDSDWTAFCQGDPFLHSPDFLEILKFRHMWTEVQALTAAYDGCDVPPRISRELDDHERIGSLRVRTERISSYTLNTLIWEDRAGSVRMDDYCRHFKVPGGWSISAHFFESCGLIELAEEAWRAPLGQFAYGAIFAVRNNRLSLVPKACLPMMRELAVSHYSVGFVFERLWLHLFGLPFTDVKRTVVRS